MKFIMRFIYSYTGAFVVTLSLAYLAGIANLGFSGFSLAITKLLPIFILTGLAIGIGASLLNSPGHVTIIAAGFAAFIGIAASAIANSSETPVFSIQLNAYIIGITIGIFIGCLALGSHNLWQFMRQRFFKPSGQ